VPVEFLTDQEAAAFGHYGGPPPRVDQERFFFLDGGDRKVVGRRWGDHNRLDFSDQLNRSTTASGPVQGRSERQPPFNN
jgi:hypothetical protein